MATSNPLPEQSTLLAAFSYNTATGALHWRERTVDQFFSPSIQLGWNRKYAQREAGKAAPDGYRVVLFGGRRYQAHRLIWAMVNGPIPAGMLIDHINGVPDDNRIENLRLATPQQNTTNSRQPRNSSAPYKGITWISRSRRWRAQIKDRAVRRTIGEYRTPEEAHAAYMAAAKAAWGEFSRFDPRPQPAPAPTGKVA